MLQQQLYKIPISQIKKHDLGKLCNQMLIPAEVQEWYNTILTSARAVDTLPALLLMILEMMVIDLNCIRDCLITKYDKYNNVLAYYETLTVVLNT